MQEPLAARHLAQYGLRRGAYNGGNKRRFVLFEARLNEGVELRMEFDNKTERDEAAMRKLIEKGYRE